eukprot:Colp12_sorted_trinity150504_noHs@14735
MRFAALAFVVCLAGTVVASTLPWVHVDTNTHNFVDEYNRTVLLHGINIVYKLSPFLPPETKKFNVNNSLSDDDFELLRKWGFNLVRLGFIWEGFEREPGKYNYEYLERMKGVVRKLARKGIYTIIDNHQDLLSPFFCGEGLPEYMATLLSPENKNMSLFPAPTDLDLRRDPKTGYPLPEDCKKVPGPGFARLYMSYQLNAAAQEIYDNVGGKRDAFARMWGEVAKHFKDMPEVLGYELWNEPWGGDVYRHPRSLVDPGFTERKNLLPLYQSLHKAIRESDERHIVIYESPVANHFSVGFPDTPGGASYNDRQASAYHIYCPNIDATGAPTNDYVCDTYARLRLGQKVDVANKEGTMGIMTEFGSTDNTPSGLRHIKVLADIADTKLQSWAYWQYKLYDDISTTSVLQGMFDESGPVEGKVHALARPYPMATQGLLQSVNFNAENTTFTFTFTANPSIRAPTEVYLGAHNFPAGCHVAVMPRMTTHFYLSENLNRLTVKLHKWVKPETPITVTVTAPQPSA